MQQIYLSHGLGKKRGGNLRAALCYAPKVDRQKRSKRTNKGGGKRGLECLQLG